MNKTNHYKVTLNVQNGLGVLARITILLRKFNVNIQTLEVEALDDNKEFYNIYLLLDSQKDSAAFSIVMKKMERLIPVVSVSWQAVV